MRGLLVHDRRRWRPCPACTVCSSLGLVGSSSPITETVSVGDQLVVGTEFLRAGRQHKTVVGRHGERAGRPHLGGADIDACRSPWAPRCWKMRSSRHCQAWASSAGRRRRAPACRPGPRSRGRRRPPRDVRTRAVASRIVRNAIGRPLLFLLIYAARLNARPPQMKRAADGRPFRLRFCRRSLREGIGRLDLGEEVHRGKTLLARAIGRAARSRRTARDSPRPRSAG